MNTTFRIIVSPRVFPFASLIKWAPPSIHAVSVASEASIFPSAALWGNRKKESFSSNNNHLTVEPPTPSQPLLQRQQELSGLPDLSKEELSKRQALLLNEASSLTRALYRNCLRSIRVLARGNERDESDFAERESLERFELDECDGTGETGDIDGGGKGKKRNFRISMSPPVNRQNELQSRANYYKTFTRENFDGHFGLLFRHGFYMGDDESNSILQGHEGNMVTEGEYQGGHHHLGHQWQVNRKSQGNKENVITDYYVWREEQIEKFLYLMKFGEKQRKWVLDDYGFLDPCNPLASEDGIDDKTDSVIDGDGEKFIWWSHDLDHRLQKFETSVNPLVLEMYRRRGWSHSSDFERMHREASEFCDDDEDEFKDDEL